MSPIRPSLKKVGIELGTDFRRYVPQAAVHVWRSAGRKLLLAAAASGVFAAIEKVHHVPGNAPYIGLEVTVLCAVGIFCETASQMARRDVNYSQAKGMGYAPR